ncbi:MAG TPA: HAD family hydrolase [Gaiellaceae bacterium]
MVEAVTFDFWNTLMWEEPGSLREKRLEAWRESLGAVDEEALQEAHDAAHQEYVDSWVAGRQFRVEEAVAHMLSGSNGSLGRDAAPVLVEGFSEGGRRAAVHPSDGVGECLASLKAGGTRIGIVCDIGLTPSPVVRELLERAGLLDYFDGMSFSDEVGHYKPHPAIFEHALAGLGGVPAERAAHVGDRVRTDVDGAAAMGMKAVRYNGVYEDELAGQREEVVVRDLRELPRLLGVE